MIKLAGALAVLAGAGVAAKAIAPELQRYMKIRAM